VYKGLRVQTLVTEGKGPNRGAKATEAQHLPNRSKTPVCGQNVQHACTGIREKLSLLTWPKS